MKGISIMANSWDVRVDDNGYYIELKKNKVIINGQELKLKDYIRKTGLIHTEYEIPVDSQKVLLVLRSLSAPHLYIDNKDCETGEEYVPLKIPVWAYVFIVLHCFNFMNGAIGGAMGVFGVALTVAIACNKKMNIIIRLLLNIIVLVGIFVFVVGVGVILRGLLL